MDIRVSQLPVCRRCRPVRYCWLAKSSGGTPQLTQWALLGSAVLMEIPIAMILACRLLPFKSEPAGEYHRGWHYDPYKRFADLRSASDHPWPAACLSRVLVLRGDSDCVHLGHHVAGVNLVRGEADSQFGADPPPTGTWVRCRQNFRWLDICSCSARKVCTPLALPLVPQLSATSPCRG